MYSSYTVKIRNYHPLFSLHICHSNYFFSFDVFFLLLVDLIIFLRQDFISGRKFCNDIGYKMRVLFCLLYMCDNLRELRDNPTETIVPVVSQKKMTLYYIVLLTWII